MEKARGVNLDTMHCWVLIALQEATEDAGESGCNLADREDRLPAPAVDHQDGKDVAGDLNENTGTKAGTILHENQPEHEVHVGPPAGEGGGGEGETVVAHGRAEPLGGRQEEGEGAPGSTCWWSGESWALSGRGPSHLSSLLQLPKICLVSPAVRPGL